MSEYFDEQDRIIAEFEADAEEAALAAFEALLEETTVSLDSTKSGLISKLKIFPAGDFPVSAFSEYKDPIWKFSDISKGSAQNIHHNRDLPGSNELRRSLVYHLIPAFTPFNRIKAFASTRAKSHDYRFVEMYVLVPNRLSAIPQHINLITTPLLNQALDDAKASGQPSHYSGLFFFLRFWLTLSAHKLIPNEMRLADNVCSIDTRERHKDVIDHFNGSLQSWIPFSESELEKLVNHALFWLEEATPRLLAAGEHLIESGITNFYKGVVKRRRRQYDLEIALDIEINNIVVLKYSMIETIHRGFLTYSYSWVAEFAQAIDKVRNAVFIFIALVTGMRKNELAALKFDDVICDEGGLYWIDITRFKTSYDPNYHGETERMPLPDYAGKIIKNFKKLRSLWSFYKTGLIFQSAFANITVTSEKPQLPVGIITYLEDACGVERIHAHRFRKTIAEILINRNERNIDVIRLLFGHKSYRMTLQYISRNPYLVRSVAQALEESYSKEFHEIVSAVRDGSYSGGAAERLAHQISKRPEEFKGKHLKVSILIFITHLLSAGTPVYVGRTAVGTYCVTGDQFDESNLPPCLVGRLRPEGRIQPDPTNCQIECRNTVVIGKARSSMEENIRFYKALLESTSDTLNTRAKIAIKNKIDAQKWHLENLHHSEHLKTKIIPVLEVS